jgi:hypothetical protein
MKHLVLAVGLSVAVSAGTCGSEVAPKARMHSSGCPSWGCGENGTEMTGLLVETAFLSARPHGCPSWGCGENGTQVTGLLIDASDLR